MERARTSLPVSLALHAGLGAAFLIVIPSPPIVVTPTPVLPVDLVTVDELTSLARTAPDAPDERPPSPSAEAQPEPEPLPTLEPDPEPETAQATPAPAPPEPQKAAPPPPPQKARASPPPPPAPSKKAEARPPPPAPPQKAAPRPPAPAAAARARTEPAPPAPPTPRREAAEGLDLDRISALADASAAPAPRRAPQMASADAAPARSDRSRAAAGLGAALTASDADALRAQINACWRRPANAAEAERLIVQVRIDLAPDGTLADEPKLVRPSSPPAGDPALRVAAENALRAIRQCAPFELPATRYESWRAVLFTFDPRQMASTQ